MRLALQSGPQAPVGSYPRMLILYSSKVVSGSTGQGGSLRERSREEWRPQAGVYMCVCVYIFIKATAAGFYIFSPLISELLTLTGWFFSAPAFLEFTLNLEVGRGCTSPAAVCRL